MGTDIHAVFEAKINDRWQVIESEYEEDRDYVLFALLAGVRNYYSIEPIAANRGIPDDLSFALYDDSRTEEEDCELWLGDHSFSYITADECAAYESENETLSSNYFFKEMARLKEKYGEVRMVFGFDS
jgi:hypothetical protein